MTAYCKDCKEEVEVRICHDFMGDPEVVGATYEFIVWECTECGGQNLTEKQEAEEKDNFYTNGSMG